MIATLLLSSFLFVGTSVPEWVSALKPEGNMSLQYRERRDQHRDIGGLESKGYFRITPQIEENLEIGVEIRAANQDWRSPRGRVGAEKGFSDFQLALSQAFVAYRLRQLGESQIILSAGKMPSPFGYSPLTWDQELRPEGFYEAAIFRFPESRFQVRLHAAQWNADRMQESLVDSAPARRFWLFQQGADFHWQANEDLEWVAGVHSYVFTTPSERIGEESANRGNRLVNNEGDQAPRLQEKFAPVEGFIELRGSALGIPARVRGGSAINFRTNDQARGFHALLSIGDSWRKKGLEARLEWMYLEPHLQMAFFNDSLWGYANRHGGRAELCWGFSKRSRLVSSFLYAPTIQETSLQANRIEISGGFEMKWP